MDQVDVIRHKVLVEGAERPIGSAVAAGEPPPAEPVCGARSTPSKELCAKRVFIRRDPQATLGSYPQEVRRGGVSRILLTNSTPCGTPARYTSKKAATWGWSSSWSEALPGPQ